MQYNEKQLAAALQCGLFAYAFSDSYIILECGSKQPRADVEHDFYNEDSPLCQAYRKGSLQYEMHSMQFLFKAASATDKKSRPFDRAAYEKLAELRAVVQEKYELEKREYWRKEILG